MKKSVIGLGTRTGTDDQIGLLLVTGARDADFSKTIVFELWENADSAQIAGNLLEIDRNILFVDAANMGIAPGEFRVFDDDKANLRIKSDSVSVHGVGFADGLALARSLGFKRPIKIFGVQPFDLSPGLTLTQEMKVRLPYLLTHLKSAIAQLGDSK